MAARATFQLTFPEVWWSQWCV